MEPDDLYGLPLDRFIPERGALAKALRADKRREEAAEVAGLRKPSVAAWAVNQLVRTQGGAVQDLYDAGDALRGAQSDLLAGRGDGRALRAAGEQERAAVDRLVDAARGLLSSEGHELSPAVVDRVADTLHAAALDEDARAQVREGRLERELRHVGLGLGEGAAAPSPPPRAAGRGKAAKPPPAAERTGSSRADPAKRPKRSTPADREREADLRAEAQRAERERAEARKAARAAEVTARRRAERSRRALKAAEERRERASAALEEADDALASARAEADAAADAHERAQAELDES